MAEGKDKKEVNRLKEKCNEMLQLLEDIRTKKINLVDLDHKIKKFERED